MRALMIVLAGLLVATAAEAQTRTVLAVNIGWHVGLAFAAGDLDPEALPETADFPSARWIEVGWGDAAYYRDPNPGLGTILDAALLPTPAVLQLVAMPAHPARYLPGAEVLEIPLTAEQFERLVGYVSDHVDRAGRTRAEAIGPGRYPDSRFYPAHGRFHLGRTCNTWVAQALAAAGLAVDPEGVAQADTLMNRVRAALAGDGTPRERPSELR